MDKFYTLISKSLRSRMLGHALALMRPVVTKMNNVGFIERLDNLQQNYRYMMDYFLSGADDPHRMDLLDNMTKEAYQLLDEMYLDYRLENTTDYEFLAMLRPEAQSIPTYPEKESTENANPTFRTMWLSSPDASHLRLLRELIDDPEMEEEAMLAISGLTLSILRTFSEQGILALIEATAEEHDLTIRERAWVSVLLLLLYYDDRLRFFPEIITALQDQLMNEDQQVFATTAMICIVRTLGVEWANKAYDTLQKSITPLLTKHLPKDQKNMDMVSMDELDDFSAQLGAEFQEILQENQREIIKLSEEHLDTHFAMFKEMYNTPFFSEPFHWWLPFDIDFLTPSERKLYPIFNMLQMNDICDSDRFAFITTISRLGMINGHSVQELMQQMNESGELPNMGNDSETHSISRMLCNDYVRQAYRFFNLNPWKIANPFEALVDFPNSTIFRLLYTSASDKQIIANTLLHCRAYEQAANVFEQVVATLPTQENHARLGFCLQKMKDYAAAINYYKMVEKQGGSEWLYRQMFFCYCEFYYYDEALHYADQLLMIKPDSSVYIFEKATCLIHLELFAEALNLLYQLDLRQPDSISVARAIISCSIRTGDYEAALRYFNRLSEKNNAGNKDWINAGHVYFLQGKRMEAYQAYRRALMQMSDLKTFLADFRPDRLLLVENGLSKEEVYLMEDQLINSFSQI